MNMPPMEHLPAKEASDLETHVILCQNRYAALERRLGTVERTLDKLLWTVAGSFILLLMALVGYFFDRSFPAIGH